MIESTYITQWKKRGDIVSEQVSDYYLKQMDEVFRQYLPDSLYEDHYSLCERYGFSPEAWRQYLRDNQTFIDAELAAIAEPAARKALKRLSTANTQEVAALKTILEKSKIINDAQKQQTKIVLSFIPPTKPKEEGNATENKLV